MEDRLMYRCPFFDNENKFIGFGFYNVLKGLEPYNAGTCHRGDIQLSTGLKDKNGKLIYEGDIVQGTPKYKYIIAYSSFNACFYLQTIEPEQPNFPLNEINLKDYFEIIGNIYENKELLEEQK